MNRTLSLEGVDGTVWPLTDTAMDVLAGPDVQTFGTAPVLVSSRARINIPGEQVIGARHTSRDMILPVVINVESTLELDARLAAFAAATDATRGDVTITSTRTDGTSRSIDCRVLDGLATLGYRWCDDQTLTATLSLRAHHPYWRSTVPVVQNIVPPETAWTSGASTAWSEAGLAWSAPIPWGGVSSATIRWSEPGVAWSAPIPWSASATEAVRMVIRHGTVGDGVVKAWPTFTVQGPGTIVSATNLSTGERWRLSGLTAAEELVIVTRPGAASVRINGVLAMGRLDDGASLWGIDSGEDTVIFTHSGRSGAASFTASWVPEYLTP